MRISEQTVLDIRRALLAWFSPEARGMPWRRTRNPYAIWVSEIMLQQTQVATVTPYYRRFLARFPDCRSLAEAPLDDVLKLWEGLGYYSRARNLHKAARQIVDRFNARIPDSTSDLMSLPGIGRYTAGAIASIAFDQDEPVLDGNVTRVFCRLFRIRTPPKDASTQKKLWSLAQRLLPAGKAAAFNQALMDLGATLCTPQDPLCHACPLHDLCLARLRGQQQALPVKVTRKPIPHYDIAAGVIWKNRRILISRRREEGLLGGLWELPGGKREPREKIEDTLAREIREEVGIEIHRATPLITVRHAYSHFRITLHVFECHHRRGRPVPRGCTECRWVPLAELDHYAFPRANQKVLEALKAHHPAFR